MSRMTLVRTAELHAKKTINKRFGAFRSILLFAAALPFDYCLIFFFAFCENIQWWLAIVSNSEGKEFHIYKPIRRLVIHQFSLWVQINLTVQFHFGATILFNMRVIIVLSCLVLAYAKPQGYTYNAPSVGHSAPAISLSAPSFGKYYHNWIELFFGV